MAIRPEQLEAYWAANPGALQQAVQSNPSAFTQPSGMMADVNVGMPAIGQRDAQATQAQPVSLTDEQVTQYWQQNPDALSQAIQQNPMGFLSGGLQQNFSNWQNYENALTNIEPGGYDPAKFARDLRLEQDLAYVPGSGSGGEAGTDRQTAASNEAFRLAERLGMPLVNEQGLGLNTGFTYTRDGMIFKPADGTVGEYNIVPERTGSSSANFMTDVGIPLLLSTIAGPLSPTFGTVGAGAFAGGLTGAAQGGDLEDIARGALAGGALAGLGEYLAPTPTAGTVGADGLSNVVTNTASGAAAQVAPNLAQQTGGLFDKATGLLRSQNPVGSLARGSLTSAVGQAIMNG